MLHPSTKRLIDKLSDMTRKQRVTWTEGENATVVHDTEGYRVVLTPEPHAVLLTDVLGREIETCLPEEFADDVDAHGRPYAKFVAELYREASRHARGTEKAIRTLLAGLDAVEAEVPQGSDTVGAPDGTTDETAPLESETEITAAVATLADKINGAPPEPAAEAQVEATEPEPEPEPELEPELVAEVPTVEASEPEAPAEPAPEPEPEPEPVVEMVAEPPAPSVEVEPLPEEPSSFGTFSDFQGESVAPAEEPEPDIVPAPEAEAAEPEPEPVTLAASPEPEPEPEPEPQPAAPTLAQPISLSSIPFGFGLGAAQRQGSPSHPSTSAPESEPEAVTEAPARLVIDGTLDLPDDISSAYQESASADDYPPKVPAADPLDLPGDSVSHAPEPGNPRRFNPWN
ncbi:MAG: hypothetical protein RLO80_08145 [Hyphomonas sp.]